jgi:hypothetical protein
MSRLRRWKRFHKFSSHRPIYLGAHFHTKQAATAATGIALPLWLPLMIFLMRVTRQTPEIGNQL